MKSIRGMKFSLEVFGCVVFLGHLLSGLLHPMQRVGGGMGCGTGSTS